MSWEEEEEGTVAVPRMEGMHVIVLDNRAGAHRREVHRREVQAWMTRRI